MPRIDAELPIRPWRSSPQPSWRVPEVSRHGARWPATNRNRKADRTESPTQQLEETIQHLLAGCTQAEGLRNLQPFGAIIIFGSIEVPRNELSRAVPG